MQVQPFRRLLLAALPMYANLWIEPLAVGWLVFHKTDSAFMVALAGFCRMLPQLLFGPFAAAIADRLDRRNVILALYLLGALVSSVITVLLFLDRIHIGYVLVATALMGISYGIDFPTRRSYIQDLVGQPRILNAVSLDTAVMQFGQVIGPLLAGGLIAFGGGSVKLCYLFMAGSYLAGALLLLSISARVPRPALERGSFRRYFFEGLRFAWGHKIIRWVLIVTLVENLLVFPYGQLIPVFGVDILQGGAILTGALVAVYGVGAVVGSLGVAAHGDFIHPGRVFFVGALITSAAITLFAFSTAPTLSLLLLLIGGLGNAFFSTMQSTIVLLSSPAEMRARAIASLAFGYGGMPFGLLLVGGLSGALGVQRALGFSALAALLLVFALVALFPYLRRAVSDSGQPPSASAPLNSSRN